jgi:hypothetical protein
MWLSRGTFEAPFDTNPTLTFDLGNIYSVASMQVWNYNENSPPNLTARGIAAADILVAAEDSVFVPLITGQAFNQAPGTATDFSQTIPLGDIEIRYVQLANMTHFPGADNAFFGLSEVRFDGTLVGPPPPPPHPGLSPIFARATSFYQSGTDIRRADDVVNGSGIVVGNGHAIGPPSGTMWLSAAGDAAGDFEIDLRGVHDLNDLRIWNYNENANASCCLGRGVNEVDVYVAGQDGVYGPTPVLYTTFAQAPGVANVDFSQVASLAGSQARYIKLDIRSNHGDPTFTGLSEVKVTGTPVQGQAALPATIKAVSSNIANFNRLAEYTLNGVGSRFGDTHTNDPGGNMWLNQGTFPNVPPEQFETNPEITFDLGSEVALGRMKVWNYGEYRDDLRVPPAGAPSFEELLGRGIRHADILVAGEDMVFRPLIEGYEFARVPDVGDLASFLATDFGQVVDLGGVVARYVKFDILSNHNGKIFVDPFSDDGFFNFAGLSEVQFFAVPEPSTYLMAVIAALVALGLRRRSAR